MCFLKNADSWFKSDVEVARVEITRPWAHESKLSIQTLRNEVKLRHRGLTEDTNGFLECISGMAFGVKCGVGFGMDVEWISYGFVEHVFV